MSWFRPKIYFKWNEPKAVLQARDAEEYQCLKWWYQPLGAIVIAGLLLLNWYLLRFVPGKYPGPLSTALFRGLLGGVFFAYMLPWIITLCPSQVRLSETSITQLRGNTSRRIKYSEVEYFAWRMVAGSVTLAVKPRKRRREVLLGLPVEVSKDAVHSFLLSRGVMPQPVGT